ncbi:hypothetical protein RB199_32505 [Streptomyces libani]
MAGGAQHPRRVVGLRVGARRITAAGLFGPRDELGTGGVAPGCPGGDGGDLVSSVPCLSKVGSTIVGSACRACGVVDRVRVEEERRGFGRVVTVASLSCSPVRRNRCWNIEPPVVATTLTRPAPMIVP